MHKEPYDPQNIFAKILRGDIPSEFIYENEGAVAFHDLYPKASVHVLMIPKGSYVSFYDFSQNASATEMKQFNDAIHHVVDQLGLDQLGFRLISNCGTYGGQEVPHYHVHILGGEKLGGLVGS